MDFKDRLKELRMQKDLSQSALAKKLNISKSTISMLEVGARQPSIEVLELIADFFNVSLDYLNGNDDISLYYLSPLVYDIAVKLHNDDEMFLLVERAESDPEYRDRLLQIVKLMGDK